MEALNWDRQASCEGEPLDVFFEPVFEERAKLTCAACPVRPDCLAYALETDQEYGVWGGMGEAERAAHLRSAVATEGLIPLKTVTYTTRARSTGAVCSAGRTEEGWGAACVSHGTSALARSRTDAETAVSRPQEWCPACAPIAAGHEPKVAR